jgi:hypothetical protein
MKLNYKNESPLINRSIVKYYSMSITVLVGLFFSIIATKLVMTIENRQSIISGLYNVPVDLIVSDTIGTHKLTLMKLTIRILYRVSMAIFYLQGLYPKIGFPPVTSHSNNK